MAVGPAINLDIQTMRFGADTPPLFEGLRLDVQAGEVVALIGVSGVGKTTLLRMIGGVETRYDGAIKVDGLPAHKAPVPGFVFQDARLLPWLTVAGNIRAVRPGISADRIAELLGRVGLADQHNAWPRQLSGGMQRRLGLARAIAVNPRLLLLDEPFVSLDRRVVADIQALFLGLFTDERPTVILVSHDPEDAARLADRVVILSGRPARISADFPLAPQKGPRGPLEVARLVQTIETAGNLVGP